MEPRRSRGAAHRRRRRPPARISQALASHHLCQLAKYGYVERGSAGNNRDRPWQLTATSHSFAGDDSPEGWEAVEFLDRYVAEQAVAQLADWQERRADEDPRWSEHSGVSQSLLYLTVDELAELSRARHDSPGRTPSAGRSVTRRAATPTSCR